MTDPDRPTGQRFSLVYLRTEEVSRDNPKFRRRVYHAASVRLKFREPIITDKLEGELGIPLYSLEKFFENESIEAILDSINVLIKKNLLKYTGDFIEEIRRIFEEQQMAYEIDGEGGIHPRVDADFQVLKISTIRALSGEQFVNARERFEAACDALKEGGPTGDAIDKAFRAAENLFRQLFSNEPRLTADAAGKRLLPRLQATYEGNEPAKRSAGKMCASFADWIDAAHFYRHEQGGAAPTPAPLDYAVLMVNQGAGYLRWLAQNYNALSEKSEEK